MNNVAKQRRPILDCPETEKFIQRNAKAYFSRGRVVAARQMSVFSSCNKLGVSEHIEITGRVLAEVNKAREAHRNGVVYVWKE